jgi:hypothetical protein
LTTSVHLIQPQHRQGRLWAFQHTCTRCPGPSIQSCLVFLCPELLFLRLESKYQLLRRIWTAEIVLERCMREGKLQTNVVSNPCVQAARAGQASLELQHDRVQHQHSPNHPSEPTYPSFHTISESDLASKSKIQHANLMQGIAKYMKQPFPKFAINHLSQSDNRPDGVSCLNSNLELPFLTPSQLVV